MKIFWWKKPYNCTKCDLIFDFFPFLTFLHTRIMVFKGMVFKSKYWIWEKIKGVSVSDSSISKGISYN